MNVLKKENEKLLGGQREQFQQSQSLAEELKITAEQLREVERGGGIGEGLNEFNPVLMQELERLRAENKTMSDKLDKSSLEKLAAMEKEINDQKAINSSLQVKWTSSKDSLANANNQIAKLTLSINCKELELLDLVKRFNESTLMAQEEINMVKHNTMCLFDAESIKFEIELSRRKQDFDSSINKISESLKYSQTSLVEANNEIELILNENKQQNEKIITLEKQVSDLTDAIDEERKHNLEIIEKIENEYKLEIENIEKHSKDNTIRQEEKYCKLLDEEKSRYFILKADLEEETIKRRKVERVKKFYEAEVQRHKTQLQVVTNSADGISNKDIDSVIKELKAMQQELDEARQEINFLRNNNVKSVNSESLDLLPMPESTSRRQSISGKMAGRVLRSKEIEEYSDGYTSTFQFSGSLTNNVNSSVPFSTHPSGQYGLTGYLEQAELSEKKIDVLTREKREMISKTLEENKEKMEISQKLLLSEKEISTLKAELRKITVWLAPGGVARRESGRGRAGLRECEDGSTSRRGDEAVPKVKAI